MCEIYSGTEPELFELKTRSIRIDGVVTSIRLEAVFWQLLEQIAADAGMTLGTFITRIYREVLERRGETGNFTSLLRVACTTHLNQGQRLTLTGSAYQDTISDHQDPVRQVS
ncbi:MAG: ribbon-helix-helix domain-containing protein [Saccharospirillaceae bacterium]|nr:ribbon-helix-helix domain-containing protein [Saccharospirillaceae bacterium]MCD8531567.1 ribbon-helix-helix domain-containing protein [Saccharospirillaceae bacterium]